MGMGTRGPDGKGIRNMSRDIQMSGPINSSWCRCGFIYRFGYVQEDTEFDHLINLGWTYDKCYMICPTCSKNSKEPK